MVCREPQLFQDMVQLARRLREAPTDSLGAGAADARFVLTTAHAELTAELRRLAFDLEVWEAEHGAPPRGSLADDDFEDALLPEEKKLHDRAAMLDSSLHAVCGTDLEAPDEACADVVRLTAMGEQFEACVGIADEDMFGDSRKQWQFVESTYKQILARAEEQAAEELAAKEGGAEAPDAGPESELRRALLRLKTFAQENARKADLAKEAADSEEQAEKKRRPPGAHLPPHVHCTVAEFKASKDGGERLQLLVPSATAPLSMFDAHFWPCAFPRQFPYGDGGFGLERDVDVTLEEYLSYILQREELEYPDFVASPPASGTSPEASAHLLESALEEEALEGALKTLNGFMRYHVIQTCQRAADFEREPMPQKVQQFLERKGFSELQLVVLLQKWLERLSGGDCEWLSPSFRPAVCAKVAESLARVASCSCPWLKDPQWWLRALRPLLPEADRISFLEGVRSACVRCLAATGQELSSPEAGFLDDIQVLLNRHGCGPAKEYVLLQALLEELPDNGCLAEEPDLKMALEEAVSSMFEAHARVHFTGLGEGTEARRDGVASRADGGSHGESSSPGRRAGTLGPEVSGEALRQASRWCDRDFVSGLYCYWRRRSYIRSARLFADRQQFSTAMTDLGRIDPDELFEALGHLKSGQGTKELLSSDKVSGKVKACLRSVHLCMNNVLGTNAHRTFLRHVVAGYRNLWGPPLVFTTMNVADTKHPVMKLMYDGQEVCAWRVLEEDVPQLGSARDLARRVAADPVSQAIFTDLMMRLFFKHMLGVDLDALATQGDGVVGSGVPCLFGDVQAFFAPLESQGRGGLHAHMSVWVLHAMKGRILDKLRHGELDSEAWRLRLQAWRVEVLEKVGSMQFDSVEEIARQTGCDLGEVEGLRRPCEANVARVEQCRAWFAGYVEEHSSLEAFVRERRVPDAEARSLREQVSAACVAAENESAALAGLCAEVSDVACKVCKGTALVGHCPGCLPREVPERKDAAFVSWHDSLPWKGSVYELSDARWERLLAEARSLKGDDRLTYCLLGSVEYFSRYDTMFQRGRCSELAEAADLLLGVAATTLQALRESSEAAAFRAGGPGATRDRCQDAQVQAFLDWHRGLLSRLPSEWQERRFLEDMHEEATKVVDRRSAPLAALALSVACFLVSEDRASLASVKEMISGLRLYAAGLAVAAASTPLLDEYRAWRSAKLKFFEERKAGAAEHFAQLQGLYEGDLPPLPLSEARQRRTCTDGALEVEEARALEAPAQAADREPRACEVDDQGVVQWRDGAVLQVPRQRPYAPLRVDDSGGNDPCSECPAWRRAPPYASSAAAGGRAVTRLQEPVLEAQVYGRKFAADARRNYVRSHIHRCKKTCLKCGAGKVKGAVAGHVCRFHFVHGVEVLYYPRRWPGKLTPCGSVDCVLRSQQGAGVPLGGTAVSSRDGDGAVVVKAAVDEQRPLHPCHCPPPVPFGYVKRLPRLGKRLILPRGGCRLPHVCLEEAYGSLGKIAPLRYHPDCSSSHPALQVCFRCNFDVQCTDRVPVLCAFRKVLRRRRVRRSAVECVQQQAIDAGLSLRPGEGLGQGLEQKVTPRTRAGADSEEDGRTDSVLPPPRAVAPVLVPLQFEEMPEEVPDRAPSRLGEPIPEELGPRLRASCAGGGLDDSEDDLEEEPDDVFCGFDVGPPEELPREHGPPEGSGTGSGVRAPRRSSLDDGEAEFDMEDPGNLMGEEAWEDLPPDLPPGATARDALVEPSGFGAATRQSVLDDPEADFEEEREGSERGPRKFQLRIHRSFSDLIAAGVKTVEARARVGRAAHVREGDSLVLNDVVCVVVRVRGYDCFRSMLEAVVAEKKSMRAVLPGCETLSQGVDLYHSFQDYEELASRHGVVAFDVELAAQQPFWQHERAVVMTEEMQEEHYVAPEDEERVFRDPCQVSWQASVYEAFKRAYRVMSNIAHYQTDYSTKANPMVGQELAEQFVGVERLRKEEERDGFRGPGHGRLSVSELQESGRRTLIRLQTAANRAALKKLPEMVFQMLFQHECYQSHKPWTIFCKGLMWHAFGAGQLRQELEKRGDRDLAWTQAKKDVLGEIRKMESSYPGMEAEPEQERFAEPAGSGQVGIAAFGRTGKRGRKLVGVDEEQGSAEDGGGNADPGEGDPVVYVSPARSMKQDWLHRGDRPLLAGMGLYHYAMFVYTTHVPAKSVPRDDFFTYRFADSHPDAATRVQKLRVHDLHRVPKILGFTMPREDGSAADLHRNAMFKSALFRPAFPVEDVDRDDELTAAMLAWVDQEGRFAPSWKKWWDNQAVMADRFDDLQRRARRIFTLADTSSSVGYMQPVEMRTAPSVHEFLAHITVEAAMHLEVGAQARASRPVLKSTPGGGFGFDGDIAEEDGCEAEAAGEVDDGTAAGAGGPRTKQTAPLYRIDASDACAVARAEDNHPDAQMKKYYDDFESEVAPDLMAGVLGGNDRLGDPSGLFAWPKLGRFDHNPCREAVQACLARQKKMLDEWKNAEAPVPDVVPAHEEASNGFIYWNPSLDPGLAELKRTGQPSAIAYVQEATKRLGEGKKPVVLNQEQREFLALVASHCQDWQEYQLAKAKHEFDAIEPAPMRVLLCGPGGAGKSELIKIVRGLCEFCFGADSHKALASSNSAARGVGGDTVHSGLFLGGLSRLGIAELSKRAVSRPFVDAWSSVHCLMLEEVSMIHPQMLGGISYRLCKGRQEKFGCDPNLYVDPEHMFGRIPLVIMLGDFMQLAPIDERFRRVSLIMEPEDAWPEDAKAGQRAFHDGTTHVVFLRQTHRFKTWNAATKSYEECPVLPKLLAHMREPVEPFTTPDSVWLPLRRMLRKEGEDDRASSHVFQQGYEMAIAWHAVLRMMQYRAAREASAARCILLYVQAVDVCRRQRLDAAEYRKALQVVNMTNTGKLLGMCPLFIGMRVRVGTKLSVKHQIMHDAPGTVVGIQFDSREDLSWQQSGSDACKRGNHLLRYLPQHVYVKFDDVNADLGFGEAGVLAVEPATASWKFKTHDRWSGLRHQVELAMSRTQVPLCPEKIRTVQTAQGLSMDACRIYCGQPSHMKGSDAKEDDYWIHLYVMLSRVRSARNVLLYQLPDRRFLGRGPPAWMRSGIQELEAKAEASRGSVLEAARRCCCFMEPGALTAAQRARVAQNREIAIARKRQREDARDRGGPLQARAAQQAAAAAAKARQNHAFAQGRSAEPSAGSPGLVDSPRGANSREGEPEKSVSLTAAQRDRMEKNREAALAIRRRREEARGKDMPLRAQPAQGAAEEVAQAGRAPCGSEVRGLGQSAASSAGSSGFSLGSKGGLPGRKGRVRFGGEEPQTSETSAAAAGGETGPARSGGFVPLPYLTRSPCASLAPTVPPSQEMLLLLRQFPHSRVSFLYQGVDVSQLQLASVSSVECVRGLPNPGGKNLCFMNSSLQCFLRLEPVASLLCSHEAQHSRWGSHVRESCAACLLAELCRKMREGSLSEAWDFAGHLRRGAFGAVFASPNHEGIVDAQADATELLLGDVNSPDVRGANLGLTGVLNGWEEEGVVDGESLPRTQTEQVLGRSFHVMDRLLFGIVWRSRKFCRVCGYAVDALQDSVGMQLGFQPRCNRDDLVSMLSRELKNGADEDTKCDKGGAVVCTASGPAQVAKEYYMDREPPILAIRLLRGSSERQRKVSTLVDFPEVLTCMRSGEYHLAGVIQHHGLAVGQGHYTAICWHGHDVYWLYDDDKRVERVSSQRLKEEAVQRDCYMLLYVRTKSWSDLGSVGDAFAVAPCVRDAASEQQLRWDLDGEDVEALDVGAVVPGSGLAGRTSRPALDALVTVDSSSDEAGDAGAASPSASVSGSAGAGAVFAGDVSVADCGAMGPASGPIAKRKDAPARRSLERHPSMHSQDPQQERHSGAVEKRPRAKARLQSEAGPPTAAAQVPPSRYNLRSRRVPGGGRPATEGGGGDAESRFLA